MGPELHETDRIEVVLCDLDGVVWLAGEPIPGAAGAIAGLRASGRRVLFVTNNSSQPVAAQERALAAVGVPADGDVVTSSMAAAHLIARGERVLVTGGPGVVEAVEGRDAVAVVNDGSEPGTVDAVVVGIDHEFDYRRLTVAGTAVRRGARLIATNTDATFPTPSGLVPGAGAIVAAVETVAGVAAQVAGKPHRPMADLIAGLLAPVSPAAWLMVGDRPETDGRFAAVLGAGFALVRSGVTVADAAVVPRPALDCADLGAVAAALGVG